MKAGEVDYSDGKGYSVPVLGPYSSKFVTETAQRVSDGKIMPKHMPDAPLEVHRANPTPFESTDDSILEASKLLERGGMTPEEYYSAPEFVSSPAPAPQQPIQIGFTPSTEPTAQAYDSMTLSDTMQQSAPVGFQTGGYYFQPYDDVSEQQPEIIVPAAPAIVRPAKRTSAGSHKVSVRARRNKR